MGRLRIIAGSLKGRRIQVPPDAALRPTADRVREALFSILGTSVLEAELIDAYAGSGALGFEALSRGAARVVFLESDPRVARALRAAAGALGVSSKCTVLDGRVAQSLLDGRSGGPFDLILADPPYDDIEEVARFLPGAAGQLRPEGRLVLERPATAETAACAGLLLARSARYGRCRLDFYRLGGPAESRGEGGRATEDPAPEESGKGGRS